MEAAAGAQEGVAVAVAVAVGRRWRWRGGGGGGGGPPRLIRPIELPNPSAYHMFPSGPAVIPNGYGPVAKRLAERPVGRDLDRPRRGRSA